jgi:hypothetical protein
MSRRYQVEATEYGVHVAVGGFVSADEITAMDQDLEGAVEGLSDGCGMVLDLRASPAFSVEAAERLKRQLDLFRDPGMERGAHVLASAIMAIQARRIVSEVGLLPNIRVLVAAGVSGWEVAAVAWADRGEEPPEERGGGKD